MRPGVDRPDWNYPALVARIGQDQRPGLAALRALVRRLRREAGLWQKEPARQRQWMRRAVTAMLDPDAATVEPGHS